MKYFLTTLTLLFLFTLPLSAQTQRVDSVQQQNLSFVVQSGDYLKMEALVIYLNREDGLEGYHFSLKELCAVADSIEKVARFHYNRGFYSIWVESDDGHIVGPQERENIIGWIISFETGRFIQHE
jgi:hypothetical protein